jgi:hypothetical protein
MATVLSIYRTNKQAGLKVLGNISLVGFDGVELAAYCDPPLTRVRVPAMGNFSCFCPCGLCYPSFSSHFSNMPDFRKDIGATIKGRPT